MSAPHEAWRNTTPDVRRERLAARRHILRVLTERRLARESVAAAPQKASR
jgi:hypothetical protein